MSGTHFYAVFNAEDVVRTKGTYSFDDVNGNQFLCCMIAFKVLKKTIGHGKWISPLFDRRSRLIRNAKNLFCVIFEKLTE